MSKQKVGFIGLGAMGTPMAMNLLAAGYPVEVFDVLPARVAQLVESGATAAESSFAAAKSADVLFTMIPNDGILKAITYGEKGILAALREGSVHVSCSTIHPDTSRELETEHKKKGCSFVGAPIFARADGVAKKQASFVVGGAADAVAQVRPLLETTSDNIFVFGEDAGAGNVAKLAGNFMIASAIESCAEALSLGEKNGLDREALMSMLNSTIFDCLIYKGYGNRVAARSHVPGEPLVGPGFQLDLGLKDVTLALDCAHKSGAPMPFASVLHDRFLAAQARGRGKLDWSAVALNASEEAGVDVSQALPEALGGKKPDVAA